MQRAIRWLRQHGDETSSANPDQPIGERRNARAAQTLLSRAVAPIGVRIAVTSKRLRKRSFIAIFGSARDYASVTPGTTC